MHPLEVMNILYFMLPRTKQATLLVLIIPTWRVHWCTHLIILKTIGCLITIEDWMNFINFLMMIHQPLNIYMVQQDHGRLNQRQGQRRDGRLQNRLRKIANGQIGQVIRHVQWHAEMEAKAELESVKIFREGSGIKITSDHCNITILTMWWALRKTHIM